MHERTSMVWLAWTPLAPWDDFWLQGIRSPRSAASKGPVQPFPVNYIFRLAFASSASINTGLSMFGNLQRHERHVMPVKAELRLVSEPSGRANAGELLAMSDHLQKRNKTGEVAASPAGLQLAVKDDDAHGALRHHSRAVPANRLGQSAQQSTQLILGRFRQHLFSFFSLHTACLGSRFRTMPCNQILQSMSFRNSIRNLLLGGALIQIGRSVDDKANKYLFRKPSIDAWLSGRRPKWSSHQWKALHSLPMPATPFDTRNACSTHRDIV